MNINISDEVKLSPLDLIHKRELDYLPSAFGYTEFEQRYLDKILQWVRTKLAGRFCICKQPQIDKDNKLRVKSIIGFEDKKELTYFMLACPYLRRD